MKVIYVLILAHQMRWLNKWAFVHWHLEKIITISNMTDIKYDVLCCSLNTSFPMVEEQIVHIPKKYLIGLGATAQVCDVSKQVLVQTSLKQSTSLKFLILFAIQVYFARCSMI